jgi:hypothetical protein
MRLILGLDRPTGGEATLGGRRYQDLGTRPASRIANPPTPAGAQGGDQAAPCGREPRRGMLELVRSRVAGGAGQCVSLGLAAQLGGPGRGQVVDDGGVHGGLLVAWMVVLGRLDGAHRGRWVEVLAAA